MKKTKYEQIAGDLFKETDEIKKTVKKTGKIIPYGTSTRKCGIVLTIHCC